jgi:hypothetical protein
MAGPAFDDRQLKVKEGRGIQGATRKYASEPHESAAFCDVFLFADVEWLHRVRLGRIRWLAKQASESLIHGDFPERAMFLVQNGAPAT